MSDLPRPSWWLLAVSGVILYAWAPRLLPGPDQWTAGAVPVWVPFVAPPLLYVVLLLGLPGVSPARLIAAVVVLSAAHGLLGALTPAIHAMAGLGPVPHGYDSALWSVPAVPVIQLFATPLAAFPLRALLVRPRRRRARGPSPAGEIVPTPTPMRAGRGWDMVTQHTAGGERLREDGVPPQVMPEARRVRRELPRPAGPRPEVPPAARPSSAVEPPVAHPIPETPGTALLAPGTAAPSWPRMELAEPVVAEPAVAALPATPAAPVTADQPASEPAVEAVTPRAQASGPPPTPITAPSRCEPTVAEERVAEPAPPLEEPAIDEARLAAVLGPVGPLPIERQALMGIMVFTACSPRLARDAVVHAAFRFLSFLAESPGPQPVTQTTIRGAAGALVLTPLGNLARGGPVLAAAIPQRGGLALLELLSLRIAAEYRATGGALMAGGPPRAATYAERSRLVEAALPPRVELLARSLTAGGPFRPIGLEDAEARLLLYLMVGPDVDEAATGRFAADLYRVMELEDEPGGLGSVESVAARFGTQRVVIRPACATLQRATLLVTAGPADDRPGLAGLQLERAASRLAATPV